jgi:predicted nucleotidyltransferase
MRSVLPAARGPVLAVLHRSGGPLTGRQIAELTRPPVSQTRTADILRDLASAGLVSATPAGPAVLYAINTEHLLYDAVAQLVTVRERLWERIAELVGTFDPQPVAVAVFGSAARGDGHLGSDIDILVVPHDDVDEENLLWQHSLSDLADSIRRWTGNDVDLLSWSSDELEGLAEAGERLLAEIRREGHFIVGSRSSIPTPRRAT